MRRFLSFRPSHLGFLLLLSVWLVSGCATHSRSAVPTGESTGQLKESAESRLCDSARDVRDSLHDVIQVLFSLVDWDYYYHEYYLERTLLGRRYELCSYR